MVAMKFSGLNRRASESAGGGNNIEVKKWRRNLKLLWFDILDFRSRL
jgi:hypothetical protein